MSPQFDLIIIGAGAAGLMCAATAASCGSSVLVIDHAEKAGKKILISGGGRCNFTNRFATAANFISQNSHYCKSALARFTAQDFIERVEAAGISYHERSHGQLFCDESAKQIVEMLLEPCREFGVKIQLSTTISDVQKNEMFELATDHGGFQANSLVVATGGLSIPKMGASSFGLKLAEQFGLNVIPTQASLVPFTFSGHEQERLKALAGISLDVTVSHRGKSFTEAMLFTHRGLSGPAMLQISSYWSPGETLLIDLLPVVDVSEFLVQKQKQRPQAQLATVLAELLPKRLVQLLFDEVTCELRMNQLSEQQRLVVIQTVKQWQLKPNGTEGYRTAEATIGGVDTNELSSKTMESKKVPGLYFIGEVVDVTGQLGGFNFQWAWSSGYAAGMAAVGAI